MNPGRTTRRQYTTKKERRLEKETTEIDVGWGKTGYGGGEMPKPE